jgi:hypothetical protein
MWLSGRDDTDERELGGRVARALDRENIGTPEQRRAVIFGRGVQAASGRLTRGAGRTQRELGKVRG